MNRGETKKEEVIRQYIQAYNDFDVDSMLAMLHSDIMFQNISNGETTAQTSGKSEFETLARQTVSLFKARSQSVRSLRIQGERAVAEIRFLAVFARDIPGGPRAGEKLELEGTSEFLFKDGLIRSIIDRS
jgi:SnoaL-like domain